MTPFAQSELKDIFTKPEINESKVEPTFDDCTTVFEEVHGGLIYKARYKDYVKDSTCWGDDGETLHGSPKTKTLERKMYVATWLGFQVDVDIEVDVKLYRTANKTDKRVRYKLNGFVKTQLPLWLRVVAKHISIQPQYELTRCPFETTHINYVDSACNL